MTMNPGERQVAPTLDGIRRDHVARYVHAARAIPPGSTVIDFACGVGYGSKLLADRGHRVHAYDVDAEALAYARQHFRHPCVAYMYADGAAPPTLPPADAAVCFETIEHIEDPRPLLRALRRSAGWLYASVPNEAEFPFTGQAYHYRHYTRDEFAALLAECGWSVEAWGGQEGPESDVRPGGHGRTLVAIARRDDAVQEPGRHIAILGFGPSVTQFLELSKRAGGRSALFDEVWTINALGDVFACDLVFHMDDIRVQLARAAARPESNIARMVEWLKRYRGRVMTSRPHPDFPSFEAFPLAEVLTAFPCGYFNSTAAYAVAYAIYTRARKITIFGNDFTYPNAHDAERGRACVEFWLGIAHAHGIEIGMPKTSSLMDAIYPQGQRFYGYDCVELGIRREGDRVVVDFTERGVPSAEEMERRYDHAAHPNPLMVEVDEGGRPT